MCSLIKKIKDQFQITKIELESDNVMLRVGTGWNKKIWYARVDLWSVGYRLTLKEK